MENKKKQGVDTKNCYDKRKTIVSIVWSAGEAIIIIVWNIVDISMIFLLDH